MSLGSVSLGQQAVAGKDRQHDFAESLLRDVLELKQNVEDEIYRVGQVTEHLMGVSPPTNSPVTVATQPFDESNVQGALTSLRNTISRLRESVGRLY